MRKLLASAIIFLCLTAGARAACPYTPPITWYWSVQDSSPGTQVWNGNTGAFVVLADATYVAWLALGCSPTSIDTAANLWSTINSYASGFGRGQYQTYSSGAATVQMTNPVAHYVNAALTNLAPTLVLPQQNLPTSMGMGQQTLITASGGFDITVNLFDGVTTVYTIKDGETASVVPVANDSQNGTWAIYTLPRVTPTNASNLTAGTVAAARLTGTYTFTGPTLTAPVLGAATATSLAITGTAGVGFVEVPAQSSAPAVPAAGYRAYADSAGRFTWLRTDGFTRTLASSPTANRTYTFPDIDGTIAILGAANVFTAAQTVSGASFTLSGNISAAAWTTSGIRYKNVAGTMTDTTSSGTVAAAYTNVFGGSTIAASAATTFTNYFNTYFNDPVAGTNVTMTNKWALGADSARFGSVRTTGNAVVGDGTGVRNLALSGGTGTAEGTYISFRPGVNLIGEWSSLNGGPDSGMLFFNSAGSYRMNALVQTDAAQSGTMCYSTTQGIITYDSANACGTPSSMRFKHDWRPLPSALDKVLRLEAGSFLYNDAGATPGEQIGLNAENMATVDTRLVAYDGEGRPRAVRYLNTIALLVKAIQELKADNDNLHTRIEELRKVAR